MFNNSTRSGILITSFVMTALVASSISMAFISINPQGMSGYQTGGNPILKYVTASSEGEGGGEGDGSDDDQRGDGTGDQGTSVGGEVSEGKGIETRQVDETTNEEDTDAEDEEQQQPIPTPTLSPTPNSLRFSSLCQAVPSLCSTTPTPLVLTPGNLIPGIPIGGLPTAAPTPTPTPPPLFGRNVPLQGVGLFGQQPAAIVPPTPVPTPVLTPEPPVPMFGSTLQATPTPEDQTLKSLCIINPNLPQCQPKTLTLPITPSPTPSPVLPQSLCIINPNHPDCRPAGSVRNFTQGTVQSLCIINPNHPDCPFRPLGRSSISPTPPPTPGSQSSTPQSLCIINPNLPQCQSTSASIPRLTLTPTPNSDNTGVGQAVPKSNTGDLFASPFSSELQTELPKTTTTQRVPDTLFSGPKSAPGGGGGVSLRDPVLVPGPDEEGAAPNEEEEQCVAIDPRECNFPYPISQDEICRNGIDDDADGKVDEAYPCSEVPGQSKPKPRTDDVLVPIPGSPLGPPQN